MKNVSYISGNITFLAPSLKNFYFRRELSRPESQKFVILFLIKKQNVLN